MRRFNGRLRKIQLISNNICYVPCPEPGDVVEQHLTMTSDGRVWISQYYYVGSLSELSLKEKLIFKVSQENMREVFNAVSEYFGSYPEIHFITDVGSWDLALTFTDGFVFKESGSLYEDLHVNGNGLSDMIRSRLGRSDLFVFDGGPADETNTSC